MTRHLEDRAAPPGHLHAVSVVLARNLKVWRRYFLSSVLGNFTEPLLYLLALGYGLGSLVSNVEGISYVQFIAPGLVVSACMYGATFEGTYGTFTRLVPKRTFDGILATPVEVAELVVGEILFAAVKSFANGLAVLIVATAFGLVASPLGLWVVPVAAVTGVLFGGMAVLVSGLSPSHDFFNYYFTLVVMPLFLFSGIFFPLSQLPTWAQVVAWFSPLAHATTLSRNLFLGCLDWSMAWDALWLLVAAAAPILPAIAVLHRRLIK